ncbi:MAG: bifunctional riboflavin kinase/FAD synthetase [Candidatus Sericytochromatia bacterium]|nr:bifunctional riboflavin kinase/FAD synthetase [Candidatus Sericytochromatia bacterium]
MQPHALRYPSPPPPDAPRGAVIAIGTFDGVHRGHRRLIAEAVALAEARGVPAYVFTFVEHPRSVLRPESPVSLLTPWDEKLCRLEGNGLAGVFATHFTQAFSKLTPEAFVREVLVAQLAVTAVVTGFNFRFGHRQAGTPERLVELGAEYGFPVTVVPPVEDDAGVISSSRLRALVEVGEVGMAGGLLGYAYTLRGEVVHGDKRGRTIGFPTANVAVPVDKLLPAFGVYACWAHMGSERFPAVLNVGKRPTFDGVRLQVEAHLLEGGQDLYGQTLALELVSRLRGEQAFAGVDALVAQIGHDCDAARAQLAGGVPS